MKLIYKDPHCSGLHCVNCSSKKDIANELSRQNINEECCSGEIVYYIFIDKDGNEIHGHLDFS